MHCANYRVCDATLSPDIVGVEEKDVVQSSVCLYVVGALSFVDDVFDTAKVVKKPPWEVNASGTCCFGRNVAGRIIATLFEQHAALLSPLQSVVTAALYSLSVNVFPMTPPP